MVTSMLHLSQQHTLAAKLVNTILGCVNRSVACRSREVIIASYSFRQHSPRTRILCIQIYSAVGTVLVQVEMKLCGGATAALCYPVMRMELALYTGALWKDKK